VRSHGFDQDRLAFGAIAETAYGLIENIPHDAARRAGLGFSGGVLSAGICNVARKLLSALLHRAMAQNVNQRLLLFEAQTLGRFKNITEL